MHVAVSCDSAQRSNLFSINSSISPDSHSDMVGCSGFVSVSLVGEAAVVVEFLTILATFTTLTSSNENGSST